MAIINGTSGRDVLVGTDEDDIIDGGASADDMSGGLGSDTYYVDNAGDQVHDNAEFDFATDTVYASVSYTLDSMYEDGVGHANEIEQLILTGSANLNAGGNEGDNTLIGNDGDNILRGYDGRDVLIGGAGKNTLIGGDGSDHYYVNSVDDVVIEKATALSGTDDYVTTTINYVLPDNVENLVLGAGVLFGNGNALDNEFIGNLDDNIFDGKGGVDSYAGGGGSDTYYVDSSDELILEYASEGYDTVYSSVNFDLKQASPGDYGPNRYIESLTLTGRKNNFAKGNELDNFLTGNVGNNLLEGKDGQDYLVGNAGQDQLYGGHGNDILYGGTGNDSLHGGQGNDNLEGGTGKDNYIFDTALDGAGVDTIFGFSSADDTIVLDQSVFSQATQNRNGWLKVSQFAANMSGEAQDADDFVVYNTSTGALLYDADGNGAGAAIQFATLRDAPALTAKDFKIL